MHLNQSKSLQRGRQLCEAVLKLNVNVFKVGVFTVFITSNIC